MMMPSRSWRQSRTSWWRKWPSSLQGSIGTIRADWQRHGCLNPRTQVRAPSAAFSRQGLHNHTGDVVYVRESRPLSSGIRDHCGRALLGFGAPSFGSDTISGQHVPEAVRCYHHRGAGLEGQIQVDLWLGKHADAVAFQVAQRSRQRQAWRHLPSREDAHCSRLLAPPHFSSRGVDPLLVACLDAVVVARKDHAMTIYNYGGRISNMANMATSQAWIYHSNCACAARKASYLGTLLRQRRVDLPEHLMESPH
mmetsp:Transcript_42858/g.100512  ORF Transcript_42858/g.100512 Transcript_42858/m.100512 type:complete len:252 (-) Transcript_42858:757-1512(-)